MAGERIGSGKSVTPTGPDTSERVTGDARKQLRKSGTPDNPAAPAAPALPPDKNPERPRRPSAGGRRPGVHRVPRRRAARSGRGLPRVRVRTAE